MKILDKEFEITPKRLLAIHALITGLLFGFAAGLITTHVTPVISYTFMGLAVSNGVFCLFHAMWHVNEWIDR